jgi:cation diffusion facilitator CzcD-associated flavoprotein CzcO
MKLPQVAKSLLLDAAKKDLVDKASELFDPHFIPSYNPWQQRICVCPDGDFFTAARQTDKVRLITDHIKSFTPEGIALQGSDEVVKVDMIILATGLKLKKFGGVDISVDGIAVDHSKTLLYKGFAPSNIPNCALFTGYFNASWTVRVEFVCGYLVRLLNHLDANKLDYFVPYLDTNQLENGGIVKEPVWSFGSGYLKRSAEEGTVLWQGSKSPWRMYHHYILEFIEFKVKSLNDKVMKFR